VEVRRGDDLDALVGTFMQIDAGGSQIETIRKMHVALSTRQVRNHFALKRLCRDLFCGLARDDGETFEYGVSSVVDGDGEGDGDGVVPFLRC
jgi:hypothetical protein